MPAIRLITIDLDDTLWPCDSTIMAAERAFFEWVQTNATRIAERHDPVSLREHRMRLRERRPDIAHDLTALRLAAMQELLPAFGYSAELAKQALVHFLEYRNRVVPYADVSPMLRCLAVDHCLVSVTNGNAEVDRTSLRGHFHHSYRAEDVGAAKPAPALFLAALRACGSEVAEAVHLGDDPLLDVEAARRIGMRAVWVNRGGRHWPAELSPPEAEVSDLHGFKSWLEGAE